MTRILVKGAEAALPTSAGAGTSFSEATLVRVVNTAAAGTNHIVNLQQTRGVTNVGSFSVLVFLTQRFLWPFTRLGEMVDQFERAMASTKRILHLINIPIKIKYCNLKVVIL